MPSRHVGAYQSTITSAEEGRSGIGRSGQRRTKGRTEAVGKVKDWRVLAIGIPEMTIVVSTVRFFLDQCHRSD